MRLLNSIKNTLLNTKRSARRFPVTIVISILLAILLIYFHEVRLNISDVNRDNLLRLNMVVGLGIPISLCIGLLNEKFSAGRKSIQLGLYIIGAAFLVAYYYFLLNEFEMVPMTRYFATVLFFILAFFYIPRIKNDIDYENYVIRIFSSIALTIIYSAVLYIGLAAILFTVDRLFEININSKYYYYMFLLVVFVFGVSLFLSKIPNIDDRFSNVDYSRSLKILLIYIVIPLLTAYNIILYAYFIKILATWIWPKGLVSHLVLWSSAISVGVIFLITPVLEENRVAKLFKIWFPKAVLPILVMMFMSIGLRVNQYGVTENRYYIILLGLWITGIMLYYSFKKPLKNIVIPISLSIIVLLSVYGPISSYSLSIRSQNNRLNNILQKNNMISDMGIVKNSDIPQEDKQEISNIINYFNSNHSLNHISILPVDFKTSDMKDLMGFDYVPYTPYYSDAEYFYFGSNPSNQIVDIRDYDYYVNMSTWNFSKFSIENININYDSANHILTLSENNSIIIEQDLNIFLQDIYENNKDKLAGKNILELEELTYVNENENIRLKFVFTSVNGRRYTNNDKLAFEGVDYILMIDIK